MFRCVTMSFIRVDAPSRTSPQTRSSSSESHIHLFDGFGHLIITKTNSPTIKYWPIFIKHLLNGAINSIFHFRMALYTMC